MTLTRDNMVLAILLLVVAILAAAVKIDPTEPNYEFLPEMKRSPAWSAYSENPNFANGRTLQEPVPGTIARGELPLYFAATKEDAVRAGEQLQNPFTLDLDKPAAIPKPSSNPPEPSAPSGDGNPSGGADDTRDELAQPQADAREQLRASAQRGSNVYRIYCVSCHGAGGAGDGPVAKRGFPPPPPLTTGKSLQMKDGQLFHLLTYGQGSMSPMAAQLSRGRRWDAINFVRSLQQAAAQQQAAANAAAPPEATPATKAAESPKDQP